MQTANLAEGLIPSSCTAGDVTAGCQPTIKSSDYTSLVTTGGSTKSAAALLRGNDTTQLVLARLSDLSGIQTASNIFFAYNPCRSNSGSNGKAINGLLGGEQDIISSTDFPDSAIAPLVVQTNPTPDAVISALNGTSNYVIGVLNLGYVPNSASNTWKFVKLDGISPNFDPNGIDTRQRYIFSNGMYPFVMTFYAVIPTKAPTNGVAALFPDVIPAVINGLSNSTLHNFYGIGYLDGAANNQQSLYDHQTATTALQWSEIPRLAHPPRRLLVIMFLRVD